MPFLFRHATAVWIFSILAAVMLGFYRLRADQIEMQNGERYVGKVLSLTNDSIIVKSDTLGNIRLPRNKVAVITLGQTVTNITPAPAAILQHPLPATRATNATDDITVALRNLGAKTNFIQQVQEQLLSSAGPEANAKYNEMVSGLMS